MLIEGNSPVYKNVTNVIYYKMFYCGRYLRRTAYLQRVCVYTEKVDISLRRECTRARMIKRNIIHCGKVYVYDPDD